MDLPDHFWRHRRSPAAERLRPIVVDDVPHCEIVFYSELVAVAPPFQE
jgi:hypothetical protein